ncbi:MAG TPA: isoprenylcysteine carboxylmethyltransferase family protein, partial [Acidimicrobiia bacterium]|nr:isoprenylcysteine carboxylmethyltransferase family protein [Acidimicrobiia bacterium]
MPSRLTAWLLVAAQFVLIGAVALAPGDHWERSSWHVAIGAVLVLGAVLIGVWAARWLGKGLTPLPLPNGRVDLITSGPYRRVRHPMYTAVILGMAGVTVISRTWWSVAAWIGLVALLTLKSIWEEKQLAAFFSNYEEYRERTGRFLPRV